MTDFPQVSVDHWEGIFADGVVVSDQNAFSITVNPALDRSRRVMLLESSDGSLRAALTPEVAAGLGLEQEQGMSIAGFRQRLAKAGILMHKRDCLFYFPNHGPRELEADSEHECRQLAKNDQAAFAEFQSEASEQDLDDSYVELDHWAVFGVFDHGRLVSAASMYPWDKARIADLGVLTLKGFRGRGYARTVVRSISRFGWDRGYEPQYRCQQDNLASTSLAKASGLALFGMWEVVSPASLDLAGSD